MLDNNDPAFNLSTPYRPIAIYLKESDSIEYTRNDGPSVHRRVDEFLTLVLDMGSREIIGFRLKGFKSFFMKEIKPLPYVVDEDFVMACSVLEKIMTIVCNDKFNGKRESYKIARDIALEDQVQLRDLPEAA